MNETIQPQPMVTAAQFRRLQTLARAYGHEWGDVRVTTVEPSLPGEARYPLPRVAQDPLPGHEGEAPLTLSLPAAENAVAACVESAIGDRGSFMAGLPFSTSHTTSSGRLSWTVAVDGAVHLTVSRPGSTLIALRALERAASDAYHAAPELQPLLVALCGDRLEFSATAAPDGPLGRSIAATLSGVWVLRAVVSSNGTVTVEERTRMDVCSDHDCAEFRHWLALQEALASLGAALPETVRPEVLARLREYDAAHAPLRNAQAVLRAAEEVATPDTDLSGLREAVRTAEAAVGPATEAIYRGPIPWMSVPVEVARRRWSSTSVALAPDGAE